MDRQQSKEETEKEKQELPLVNIEQNDSLIEKEKRIGKKVIIFFFFVLFYFLFYYYYFLCVIHSIVKIQRFTRI